MNSDQVRSDTEGVEHGREIMPRHFGPDDRELLMSISAVDSFYEVIFRSKIGKALIQLDEP